MAVTREGDIAESVGRVESAPHEAEAGTDGQRPERVDPKQIVDSGLEATQTALLQQVQAELSETEPGPVIPKARPEEISEPDVGEARSVGVAVLQAEVRDSADDEEEQILVGQVGWRQGRGQDVHGRAPLGVRHQGQMDEILDRATPDLAREALVFSLDLLLRRVRRPLDADVPEILETGLHGTVAPAERHEEVLPQLGD